MDSKKKKAKEPVTPIKNAMMRIQTAVVTAFISAAITLGLTVYSVVVEPMYGINGYALIDVAVVILLAVWLLKLKSRVASVLLLLLYLANQIIMQMNNPGLSSSFMTFYLIMYAFGIWGAFSYQRLKKRGEWGEVTPENAGCRIEGQTTAIRTQSPKGRVLLCDTFDGLEITVKRTFGMTELVVDGLVYAEKKGMVETSYKLEARLGNTLIEVMMDAASMMHLYANGNLLQQKKRII